MGKKKATKKKSATKTKPRAFHNRTENEKLAAVLDLVQSGDTMAAVADRHGIHKSGLSRWLQEAGGREKLAKRHKAHASPHRQADPPKSAGPEKTAAGVVRWTRISKGHGYVYTDEYKADAIKRQAESGLTKAAFIIKEQLNGKTFFKWLSEASTREAKTYPAHARSTRGRGSRPTRSEIQMATQRIIDGDPMHAIATDLGVSDGTVNKWRAVVTDRYVFMNPKNADGTGKHYYSEKLRKLAVKAMAEEGRPVAEVAYEYGFKPHNSNRWISEAGFSREAVEAARERYRDHQYEERLSNKTVPPEAAHPGPEPLLHSPPAGALPFSEGDQWSTPVPAPSLLTAPPQPTQLAASVVAELEQLRAQVAALTIDRDKFKRIAQSLMA